tara:strand:- start:428 stop:943 length:516 start_codon:yes stop_codon:yes gene_type:complete
MKLSESTIKTTLKVLEERKNETTSEAVRSGDVYIDKDGTYKNRDLEMTFGEKVRKAMGMQSKLDKKREDQRQRLASPEGQAREKEYDDIEQSQKDDAEFRKRNRGMSRGQVNRERERSKQDYERDRKEKERKERMRQKYRDRENIRKYVSKHGGSPDEYLARVGRYDKSNS